MSFVLSSARHIPKTEKRLRPRTEVSPFRTGEGEGHRRRLLRCLATNSFLLLLSNGLEPTSDALKPSSFLLPRQRPHQGNNLLRTTI